MLLALFLAGKRLAEPWGYNYGPNEYIAKNLGSLGQNLEQARIPLLQRSLCIKFGEFQDKLLSRLTSTSTRVKLPKIFGHQDKIWRRPEFHFYKSYFTWNLGKSGQNLEQADFHLYKGHIAKNFVSSGQNLEQARIPLLQRSFYIKFGELRTDLEHANFHLYKGHIAENLETPRKIWSRPKFLLL